MRSARFSVCLTLAALAVTLVGCGKKKAAEPVVPDIDGVAALGDGVQIVLGGDVELLAASRLVRRGVAAMLAGDLDLKSRVEAITEECQLEPGDNVVSFLIGLGEGPSDVMLVVSGTFEENALTACVQKRLLESGGRLATKPIGARTAYRADGGGDAVPVWFALGSKRTLIVAGSEDWLRRGLGEGPRFTDAAKSKKLLSNAAVDKPLWAVGLVPDFVAKRLEKNAIKPPESMMAEMAFAAGLQATLDVEMASEADANALKNMHKMQAPMIAAMAQMYGLGRLASQLKVEATGKVVKMRLVVDEAQLSDLLATVDSEPANPQNPPSPELPDGGAGQGDMQNGQGNPPSDGKAPPRR